MNTTFEVYSKTSFIPSFQDILDFSTIKLKNFLDDFEINYKPQISVRLNSVKSHHAQPLNLQAVAKWDDSTYAWFHVTPFVGGADVYFEQLSSLDRDFWSELINQNSQAIKKKELIQACLSNGYDSTFSRGRQPAIIHLAYGIIAASLAYLTKAFIYSDDEAWDYKRFPATASEFFSWYFRPELAIDTRHKEWATECIKLIPEQYE